MHYRKSHIRVKILDMPVTLQDFPENQETLYGAIIDSIVQTLDVVIEQEKSHVKKRQKDGINALRQTQAWQNYGRPAIKLPENYKRVMNRWLSGEITAVTAMNLTGLKRTTFYRLANEYKRGELTV
ncbi:hypothetical protein [Blautia sp.]